MLIRSLLLFFSTLIGGLMVVAIPKIRSSNLKYLLIFSGGYLFSSTMLHLLPELFGRCTPSSTKVGLYILAGFFFQQLIELFSGGIAHGHNMNTTHHTADKKIAPLSFLISISLHAFLDGAILCSPTTHNHSTDSLLIGIMLHKALEAFALVNVLISFLDKKKHINIYLLFFALASPIGLWFSNYCSAQLLLSGEGTTILSAVVTGNFLYISTTILFESSPEHDLNLKKLIASVAGSGLAAVLEIFL